MNPQAESLNEVIRKNNPVIFELLSERGKNIFFPKKGILGQTADAKGSKINATIGAAIEDDGSPMRLASVEKGLNLDPGLTFPYAPSFGRPDIRKKWQEMIKVKNPALKDTTISLPVVTNALTHGLSMAAYLFMDPNEDIILSDLYWGNYNLIFSNAYGTKYNLYTLFKDGGFDLESFSSKLLDGEGQKKIVLLNFPNNPAGYTPTKEEMQQIVSVLKQSAEKNNKLVVIADDAYFGLVFEEGIETQSVFAYLAQAHENILVVKLDGPTKEDYVWGFRVGFITYGIKGGTEELYSALESKTAGAVRGSISNAANVSQSLLLASYKSDTYEKEKQEKYEILKARYAKVKEVLKDPKYAEVFKPYPFNSGYFMCMKLNDGLDGEAIRMKLIEKYSTGIINLSNVFRIAFSSVSVDQIQQLFDNIFSACKE